MTHNAHTISLERLSLLLETKDPHYLLRFGWLPRWALRGRFMDFMQGFHRLFSEAEYNKLGASELIKTSLYNRLLMVKAFYDLAIIKRLSAEMMAWYKQEFRREQVELSAVVKRIEFYQAKLREYAKPEADTGVKKEVPFDLVIISVEAILGMSISREMKLYTFKHYYDRALDKSRKAQQ